MGVHPRPAVMFLTACSPSTGCFGEATRRLFDIRAQSLMTEPLLKVRDLSIRFATTLAGLVHAVNDVSFGPDASGRTLAIVGEIRLRKSVLSRAILRLLPEATTRRSGQILFDGKDLAALERACLAKVRGKDIAMIFQDPMSSLNPVLTIEQQIGEVLELHLGMAARRTARSARSSCSRSVGVAAAEQRLEEYPHQLSGGHAPARDDRHGAGLPPAPPDRRRADHRAGRHHPDADPGAS